MEVVFYVIAICLLVLLTRLYYLKKRAKRRASYINNYQFPNAIINKVAKTYPHLNESELAQVMRGLREYFHLTNLADDKMISMPSQAIDVAWHEFILFTRNYQTFCKRAFGRFLHHTPAEAMQSRDVAQAGIKRVWHAACLRENIDPYSPKKLPLVFALDSWLKINDGFHYELNCMESSTVSLNELGKSDKVKKATMTGAYSFCVSHIGCSADTGFTDGNGCSGDTGGDGGSSGCGGGCGGGGD
ncbi:hypothetical protein SG34_014955 [Thalassomonas viridans]|uniref:Uncharacterized protein n=1 Tax=Thalassomonas viridans TaxID=137584 RepID=A0AAE9ZA68_9GAMM|nr:hypothetical protein [Thalassomonas viridans]WDE08078.1 hypothetical protein SG34_014955 [Thalassomonas viridans]